VNPAPEQTNGSEGGEPRVHLYDAVSTQREQVLKGFDVQREAILKAVADQHEAALAPIRAVQARQAGGTTITGVDGRVLGPRGTPSAADRTQTITEIAVAIRAIVAEEVRAQLTALLQDADTRLRAQPPAD